MALPTTLPTRQPTGPQIARLIGDSGIRTPKVRRNRFGGYYTAQWYETGLQHPVPSASFFRKELESHFDGIKIINIQDTTASWNHGKSIISTVHFEIIDRIREKQPEPLNLTALIPPIIEAIQRPMPALPLPMQPVALLPANIPQRGVTEQVAPCPKFALSSQIIFGWHPDNPLVVNPSPAPIPLPASRGGAGGGDNSCSSVSLSETDSSPLKHSTFIRANGKAALVAKLNAEAQAAGINAVRHYRQTNPPRVFPSLADMVEDAETITVQLDEQDNNSTV